MNKRRIIALLFFIVIVIAVGGISYFTASHDNKNEAETEAETETESAAPKVTTLDAAVSHAVLEKNESQHSRGECRAEGHEILDSNTDGSTVTAYVLAMYGEYGFENGDFVKVSGSGVIPTVITFKLGGDGSYSFESYTPPGEGAEYEPSIKKLFPESLWDRCLRIDEAVHSKLKEQERAYAAKYLEAIDREAVIGDYGDFEHTLLTDLGVSVAVSNKLVESAEINSYPMWIGDCERIEDGVRYVYMMSYNEEEHKVSYVKTIYSTITIVEEIVFDSKTGEKIYDSNETKGKED